MITALLCAASSCATRYRGEYFTPLDWDYVQSTGGIAIGDPYVDGNEVLWIPLMVDLSGTRSITIEPTLKNTGMKCLLASSSLSQGLLAYDIYVDVIAMEEDRMGFPGSCGQISVYLSPWRRFGSLAEGALFRVWYRDSRLLERVQRHYIDEFRL